MTALVSIVIPSYNSGRWLDATLESALVQTWPSVEIIVVDDGSRDNSAAVARRYESRGVRVISQPNRGASAARNHGLQFARGDFVQFLDADDLLDPNKIAHQVAVLADRTDGITACTWGRFNEDISTAVVTPEENWRDCEAIEWLSLNFAGRGMMPPAAWLVRRAILDRAGPWNERLTLNDDGEYFCRVLLAAKRVHFVREARVFYRSNLPGSLSRQRSATAWQSAFLSHELCVKNLLASEDSPRTRQASADLFQRLAFTMYPECPDLVARSEAEAQRHGGSTQRPGGGFGFQLVARTLGWKAARRIQHARLFHRG